MQVNRLFETVYILLNRNYITAKELAEHFEVSVRTIYRDIEVLCQSGIPIYTNKGKGGGIGLLDNFVLNKSVLSKKEQQDILSALQGLNAANYPDTEQVLSKLSNLFGQKQANWIEVDFHDWSENSRIKFNLMKNSILNKKVLVFEYYGRNGDKTSRITEPLQLWFKDKNWYLVAFCRNKSDIRTFKITRMKNLIPTEEVFTRELPKEYHDTSGGIYMSDAVTIKMKVEQSQAYRVYDEFEENQIETSGNGDFIVTFSYAEDEWVYGYILSFGCYAEVLEPFHIRNIIKERLHKSLLVYQ